MGRGCLIQPRHSSNVDYKTPHHTLSHQDALVLLPLSCLNISINIYLYIYLQPEHVFCNYTNFICIYNYYLGYCPSRFPDSSASSGGGGGGSFVKANLHTLSPWRPRLSRAQGFVPQTASGRMGQNIMGGGGASRGCLGQGVAGYITYPHPPPQTG